MEFKIGGGRPVTLRL